MFKREINTKPSGEFFATLGKYIYGYKNPESEDWDYIGKGVGDRAYAHVEDKELDWENCYLIARNLERYDEKADGAQFSMEAFLIHFFKPELNSVSGRYQEETYIMSRFSGLFEQHQNDQRKMYVELHTFIAENPIIEQYNGFACSRGKTFEVESNAIDQLYCVIKCDASGAQDIISVKFKANKSKKVVIDQIKEMCKDLSQNGEGSGSDPWVSYVVEDLDAAVELWKDFVRA